MAVNKRLTLLMSLSRYDGTFTTYGSERSKDFGTQPMGTVPYGLNYALPAL